MKFGISLLRAHPHTWLTVAETADRLGFESVWISDHLVLPVERVSTYPGALADSPGNTVGRGGPPGETFPLFDCPAMMAAMAARTSRIRLGTFVYLLGLRHPLVTARSFGTVDYLSNGRVELGVGAGWLREEWEAAGMDWSARGRALDESIGLCRRLWSEKTVGHQGETWSFEPQYFEPKPPQPGGPPILIGGESPAALRRTARLGDGWIGQEHTPGSLPAVLERLRRELDAVGRDPAELSITVAGDLSSPDEVDAWEALGVDRLIMTPWTRSRESAEGMTNFAEGFGLLEDATPR
jgi:probable F420-dependent oxidoreductase